MSINIEVNLKSLENPYSLLGYKVRSFRTSMDIFQLKTVTYAELHRFSDNPVGFCFKELEIFLNGSHTGFENYIELFKEALEKDLNLTLLDGVIIPIQFADKCADISELENSEEYQLFLSLL